MTARILIAWGKTSLFAVIAFLIVIAIEPSVTDAAVPMPKQNFGGVEVTIGAPQEEVLNALRTKFTVRMGEPDWDHPERGLEPYSLNQEETIIGRVVFHEKKLQSATKYLFDPNKGMDLGSFLVILTDNLEEMKKSNGGTAPEVYSDTEFFQGRKDGSLVVAGL